MTQLKISDNSRTDLSIICPNATLAFAADELARYLAIITGASFPLVEQADHAIALQITEGTEEHGWDVHADSLTLFGNDPLSVLHTVYHFLEAHCGCRWLSEFDGGEIIPRRETLHVPVERRSFRPVFSQRAFTNFPDIDHLTVAMCDWMVKQRFNRFMIFANVEGAFAAYERVLQREVVARGLKIELGHHSCKYFVPPAEFFAEHPEYFALIDGARSPEGQLCTSNPAVVELVAERVSRLLSDHPEIDTVGLWPNDGFGWCQCEQCLAQEPQEPSPQGLSAVEGLLWPDQPRRTDTYLRFVNAVAGLVAQEHPDRFLSALAYVNYVEPPRQVELLPQVKVYFAPFQRCFRHSLDASEECRRPNAQYAQLLQQWRQVAPGPLLVFEYLMLIDMLSVPYPLTRLLPQDLAFYRDVGVEGYVLEYRPEEWGPYGQQAYLIGRLSWEMEGPAISRPAVEEMLREHCAELYGPAAEEMLALWRDLDERFVQAGGCVHHYDLAYTKRATHQLLQPALEHLGRAMAQAANDDRRYREAVHRAQVSVQLLMRLGRWQELLQRARTMKQTKPEAARAADEVIEFARRHARSGAVFAPGLIDRVKRDMKTLE